LTIVFTQARFDAGILRLQMGNKFTDSRAAAFHLALTIGVAPQRARDSDSCHDYNFSFNSSLIKAK
jgi:hypothetical protein